MLNANDLYVTNLNLFKDMRSVTYEYDANGNIIQSKNLSDNISEFKYDKNNQLIGMIDPKGKNLVFEYDNNIPDRIRKGVSGTGISNEIEYDLLGNPITTKIVNRGQMLEISDGNFIIGI